MTLRANSSIGVQVLYEGVGEAGPTDLAVDIVAVHGIGADALRTWSHGQRNWLRDKDMLPSVIPAARILCFAYESRWLGHDAITQRLPLVADQLLRSLTDCRRDCSDRPMILLGHCFGGLVIQKALVNAKLHSSLWSGIFKSVRGVLFLGTPMHGTRSQSKAAMIAGIAAALNYGERSKLLQSIEKDSEMLGDLLHDFTSIVNVADIPLVCCFEQLKSDVAKVVVPKSMRWLTQKELVVDEASACIDGHPKIGLAANHFDMQRYRGSEDGNYQLVRSELVRFVERIHTLPDLGVKETSGQKLAMILEQRDQDCLNAIFITDPAEDLAMIELKTEKLMEHSNTWVTSNSSWISWNDQPGATRLWIHGDPGKGKTFIAIAVIQELAKRLRNNGTPHETLLYFFCDKKDDRRNNALAVIRGLLHLLFVKKPELAYLLRVEYERRKGKLIDSPTALHTLFSILMRATTSTEISHTTIVIDGLDECDDSITELLTLIESQQAEHPAYSTTQDSDNASALKWLLTSRNEDRLRQQLCDCLDIDLEVEAEHVAASVMSYVTSRVEQLTQTKKYSPRLASDVRIILQEKAQGTFLWVALACRELSKPKVKSLNTKAVLNKLPSGLVPLYDRILDEVLSIDDEELVTYARKVLHTLALAFRPLTLQEVAIAAQLPVDPIEDIATVSEYLELCSSIISVRHATAHFVHESALSYLKSRGDIVVPDHSIGHSQIALACFGYLDPETGGLETKDQNSALHTQHRPSELPLYPFIHWLEHARLGSDHLHSKIRAEARFWDTASPARQSWLDTYWPYQHASWDDQPDNFSAIHCAAYAGLTFLLSGLLDRSGTDIHCRDSLGNDGLIWASMKGWEDTVELLIDRSANLANANHLGMTALYLAADRGYTSVVKSLVIAGAEVNTCDLYGTTLVHKVATQSHIAILEYLLDSGAQIDGRDHLRWTPVQRACSGGLLPVVKSLAMRGADLNQVDREGMSLLHYAAGQGHADVATFLLDKGLSIDPKCYEQWTPLHEASWSGEESTATFLLSKGADPRQKNQEGHTPLHLAAWNGHVGVIRSLLEFGAGVEDTCKHGETALHQAAWQNHDEIVSMLLEAGGVAAHNNAWNQSSIDHANANLARMALQKLQNHTTSTMTKSNPTNLREMKAIEGGQMTFEDVHKNSLDPSVSLDPAIVRAIPGTPTAWHASHHGHAGFSTPLKIRAEYADGSVRHFFCKICDRDTMFAAEFFCLKSMSEAMPLICARPLSHGPLDQEGETFLLTEFLDTDATHGQAGSQISLAEKLARMHKREVPCNKIHGEPMFGFPMQTFCGSTPQDNSFSKSWCEFFAHRRLAKIGAICEERHGEDEELREWIERTMQSTVPALLRDDHLGGTAGIQPSLVHGDLWMGNAARGLVDGWDQVEDVCFDPSSTYAHNEYEFAIMRLFGGFLAGFWAQYHAIFPKAEPIAEYEDRIKLYSLYHILNHYALHAGGWRDDAIEVMRDLFEKHNLYSDDGTL